MQAPTSGDRVGGPVRRILVMPSWYPSPETPHVGTFFREQARLAAETFDVRVLTVASCPVGRRRAAAWLRRRLLGPVVAEDASGGSESPPHLRLQAEPASSVRPMRPGEDPRVVGQVLRRLQADGWRPDLIHVQGAMPAGVLARALAARLGVPYVVTEHQHLIFDYFDADAWAAAKAVYRDAARVAAVSAFERRMMLMNGAPANPIVVGNLVDEALFSLAGPPAGDAGRTILFVGLTSPLKDHQTFLAALERLGAQGHADIRAVMVCPNFLNGFAALEQDVRARGLQDRVRFVAAADREAMAALIHGSAALVSTSVAETFGVSVCEALMCGRPVVATESGGVSDFVQDGINGYLVPVGDAGAVADRIQDVVAGRLAASPDAIRKTVVGRYGRAAFARTLARLYGLEAAA